MSVNIDDDLIFWMKSNISYGKTVLELGSGVGTLRLKKHWNVISVEHDPAYLCIDNHKYIYAPLIKHKPIENYDSDNLWYNVSELKGGLKNLDYDVLLVDGPPAPNRIGLIKYWDMFKPEAMWIFDDVMRRGERRLIHGISNRLMRPYTIYNAWGEGKPFGVIE